MQTINITLNFNIVINGSDGGKEVANSIISQVFEATKAIQQAPQSRATPPTHSDGGVTCAKVFTDEDVKDIKRSIQRGLNQLKELECKIWPRERVESKKKKSPISKVTKMKVKMYKKKVDDQPDREINLEGYKSVNRQELIEMFS